MFDFQKLKNVNLKQLDLKSMDLKTMDLNLLGDYLNTHKQAVIQVAVVGGALLVLAMLWGDFQTQKQDLHMEVQTLRTKTGLVQSYEASQKQFKEFMDTLPKALDEQELNLQISDLAIQNEVSIVSVSSAQQKSEGITDILSLVLGVHTLHYRQLANFIKAMERAPFSLRIKSCTVIPVNKTATIRQIIDPKDAHAVEAQIEISTIRLKQ